MDRKQNLVSKIAMLLVVAGLAAPVVAEETGHAMNMGKSSSGGMGMSSGGMAMGGPGMGMAPPRGMMGGMGHGRGMMGGMGHMGMMGSIGPVYMLDLSEAQRKKIRTIQRELQKERWKVMGKMMDHKNRLEDLFSADKRDAAKIGAVYAKIFDLKRQMIESSIRAGNRQLDVLTAAQRKQLKQLRRRAGTMGMGSGMMGGMGHMMGH